MMNNPRHVCQKLPLITLSLLGSLLGQAQTSFRTRAASMLLGQYETVVYAKSDLVLRTDTRPTLALPFEELIEALNALRPDAASALRSRYSDLFVGAKDFTTPEGLGPVTSRRCYIAAARSGVQVDSDPIFQQAKQEYMAGRQVWTWETPPYEGHPVPTEFYAANAGGGLLVVTNNRQDFVAVASGLTSSAVSETRAASSPDPKGLSGHKYWAYRVFRRSGVTDMSAAAISDVTASITALAFSADADTGDAMIQVSTSEASMKEPPNVLPPSAITQMRPAGAGIWHADIRLSKDQETDNTLFQLFYYLGFGVVL